MRKILFLLLIFTLIAYSCSDKQSADYYFNKQQQDTLLVDIITYIYTTPPGATWETRFNADNRNYYKSNLPKFKFEKLFQDENGTYYFYIIRPARSSHGTLRGVGGKFTLSENGKIEQFEELFNTPAADLNELRNKGNELFIYLIKNKNIDGFVANDQYIEWPNAWTYYDTIQHQWLVKPGM
jgi:hypothetical protein